MKETNIYEAIFKRKSIRKYDPEPLDEKTLEKITEYMGQLKSMDSSIGVEMKIVPQSAINSLFAIKSPHYIVMASEDKEGYLTNAGFMLQQLDLFFSTIGLGCCWVGMAKPAKEILASTKLEFVIALAFGKPAEPLHRESIQQFQRKTIEQISNVDGKSPLIEAARIAPSGTNSQPWYFIVKDDRIHAYCIKSNIIKAILYEKMNQIDMGIAICHIWLAARQDGGNVTFISDDEGKKITPKGYYYITSLRLQ